MLSKKSIVCLLSLLILVIGFTVAKKLASDVTLNENGITPLMEAIENSNNTKAKILIALGSDLTTKSSNEETPLFIATFKNNEEIVSYILNKDKSTVNVPNNRTRLPLEVALESGSTSIATKLINAGADVNCNPSSIPSVKFAISQRYFDIAKLLIEKGANVNTGGELKVAVENDKLDIVSLLIDKGVDVKNGVELLNAIRTNKMDIAKLLIEKGADVNHKDEFEKTSLAYAVEKDNLEITKLLIDKGADVNSKNMINETPLYTVKSQAMIDLLLSKGADPNYRKGEFYMTAIAVADYKINGNKNTTNYTPISDPKIGMSASEVEKSTWGKPSSINRTTTAYGTSEQWVYGVNRYIYLDEGKVTAIQD